MAQQDREEFPISSSLDGSNDFENKENAVVDGDSVKNEEGAEPQSEQHEQDGPPPSPRNIHGFRWILAVVAVVSSILLYATDNTIVRPQTRFFGPHAPDMLTTPGCNYSTFNH